MSNQSRKAISYSLMLVATVFLAYEFGSGRAWPTVADVWFSADEGSNVKRIQLVSETLPNLNAENRVEDSHENPQEDYAVLPDNSSESAIVSAASVEAEADISPTIDKQAGGAVESQTATSPQNKPQLIEERASSTDVASLEPQTTDNKEAVVERIVSETEASDVVKKELITEEAGNSLSDKIEANKIVAIQSSKAKTPVSLVKSPLAKSNAAKSNPNGPTQNKAVSANRTNQLVDAAKSQELLKKAESKIAERVEVRVSENQAKNFSVKNLRGDQLVSLDDYEGKVVLIGFWVSWCSPCKNMLPWLDTLKSEIGDEKFEVIGMGLDDDLDEAMGFIRELETTGVSFNYPLVRSEDGIVAEDYGVEGLPSIFLLDENHNVVNVNKWYKVKHQADIRAKVEWLVRGNQVSQNVE